MNTSSIIPRPDSTSLNSPIESKSTRNSPARIRQKITRLQSEKSSNLMNGLEEKELIQSSGILMDVLEARRFMLSCILGKELTWRQTFVSFIRKQDPKYIFTDNEWLDMYQVYNEKIAFKRLLQLINQS